jgi:hypothetical protein
MESQTQPSQRARYSIRERTVLDAADLRQVPAIGARAIGRRLSILWAGCSRPTWFSGTVRDFSSPLHFVKYDDGDVKWHNLRHEEVLGQLIWLDTTSSGQMIAETEEEAGEEQAARQPCGYCTRTFGNYGALARHVGACKQRPAEKEEQEEDEEDGVEDDDDEDDDEPEEEEDDGVEDDEMEDEGADEPERRVEQGPWEDAEEIFWRKLEKATAPESMISGEHAALVERLQVHMSAHGLSQVRLSTHLRLSSSGSLSSWLSTNPSQSLSTRAAIDHAVRAYLSGGPPEEEAALCYARRARAERAAAEAAGAEVAVPQPLTSDEARAAAAAEGLELVPSSRSETGFKGVYKSGAKYEASFTENRKTRQLGRFATPEEAALCYARHARAERATAEAAGAEVAVPQPLTADEARAAAAAEGLELVPSSSSETGFKGVYKSGAKYEAKFTENGTQLYIGTFATPEEAALCCARHAGLERAAAEAAEATLMLGGATRTISEVESMLHKPSSRDAQEVVVGPRRLTGHSSLEEDQMEEKMEQDSGKVWVQLNLAPAADGCLTAMLQVRAAAHAISADASGAGTTAKGKPKFKVGDRVQSRLANGQVWRWYLGTITSYHGYFNQAVGIDCDFKHVYAIMFDHGESEEYVIEALIRHPRAVAARSPPAMSFAAAAAGAAAAASCTDAAASSSAPSHPSGAGPNGATKSAERAAADMAVRTKPPPGWRTAPAADVAAPRLSARQARAPARLDPAEEQERSRQRASGSAVGKRRADEYAVQRIIEEQVSARPRTVIAFEPWAISSPP